MREPKSLSGQVRDFPPKEHKASQGAIVGGKKHKRTIKTKRKVIIGGNGG